MPELSHRYRIGVVVVESERPLPLPRELDGAPAQVRIGWAAAPVGGDWIRIESAGIGVAWLERESTGAAVRLHLDEGAPAQGVQAFVQGLVVPTALQQAGAFFVHAASVAIGGRVVALIGSAGSGKSLLAASVARAGHRLFGDDGLALGLGADGAVVPLVGSVPLRLRDDAVRALGLDPAEYAACPTSGKRWIPASALGSTSEGGGGLGAVYFLERSAAVSTSPCPASDAVVALLAAEFHPTPASRALSEEPHRLDAASQIVAAAPMRRLRVRADLGRLGDVVDALVRDLGAIADE